VGLLRRSGYAVGFFYLVVPGGEARIRAQESALHEISDLDSAAEQLAASAGAAVTYVLGQLLDLTPDSKATSRRHVT